MGFFSWKTSDTKRSIANKHSSKQTFFVYMIDNEDNQYLEREYDGYGVFGGKDIYELIAEMNNLKPDRDLGINLIFKDNPSGDFATAMKLHGTLTPALVEEPRKWKECGFPDDCPDQGFFYEQD